MNNLIILNRFNKIIHRYIKSFYKFTSHNILENEFDNHFNELVDILKIFETIGVFQTSLVAAQSIEKNDVLSSADREILANFEAYLLAPMLGGKNHTKPILLEVLGQASSGIFNDEIDVINELTEFHKKIKIIIQASRNKSKHDKKHDKKLSESIYFIMVGIGCIIKIFIAIPSLLKVGGATGFTAITMGCQKLRIN